MMAADVQPEGGFINWLIGGGALGLAFAVIKFLYGKIAANEVEDKQDWQNQKLELKTQVAALVKKVEEMNSTIIELERKNASNEAKLQAAEQLLGFANRRIASLEEELSNKVNRESLPPGTKPAI